MTDTSYLTAEGAKQLRSELDHLKGTAREELAARLRAAIQMGDLSENADYISAKEEQAFLEGRIKELEAALVNVVIIDNLEKKTDSISIGNKVTFQEDDFDPEVYMLVGPKEADPMKGRISHESPIGRAMLGKKVGDHVVAKTPTGTFKFRILKIE
jgi:transcription elongation factor GreA